MAANHSKRAQQQDGADTAAPVTAVTANFAELGRQQMAAAEDALALMFRVAQGMQQAQLHMGQRAALLHAQTADNIRKAGSPVELAAIQSSLMVYGLQETMRYWQEVLAASAKAGSEAMPSPAHAVDKADGVTAPAAAMMEAALQAAAPMAGAFQQMFSFPTRSMHH